MKHLILGNGPTGVVAAETLRRTAPGDDILLVGDEPFPAYSRMAIPYLLEGNIDESGTFLRKTAGHFAALRIRERQARAARLSLAERYVRFADGTTEPFDRLLIATGSHPVRPPIPGVDLPQVQTCWTLADARAIAARARQGARVVQLGAGFIGCIVLESLARRGVDLTVVEMGDRMVPRMMTPAAGDMIRRWVAHKGVRVLTGTRVERIAPADAETVAVTLSSGETLAADLVIVAAGVAPNVDFLQGAGIEIGHGIRVDARMQTSVPGIFAAGDVAEAPDLFTGAPQVAAIQPNAADQGRIAGLNMALAEGPAIASTGVLAINVLATLGLISSSFGQWWGEAADAGGSGTEHIDAGAYRYLSLQFRDDVLIGATAIGLTEHVGLLRGMIQNRTRLGDWHPRLLKTPGRFVEAALAAQQATALRHHRVA